MNKNSSIYIAEIHICPVYKNKNGFKPDMSFPTRYCVIDEEKEIAIDIKTKLKYDYIKTMSHLYFLNHSYKKIKNDNRVAILPYASNSFDNYDVNKAENIINELENNFEFQNGNDIYNNKEYLEFLKQEAIEENKLINKIRKKFKK